MKKGRFLWSAHRITERQKAGKARNIKGKQLKNSRNTVSRKQEEQASSQRDRETYPSEERAAGRSPARSTAKRGVLRLRDLSQRGYSLQRLKNPGVYALGFLFCQEFKLVCTT